MSEISPEDVEQTRDYYVSEARSEGVDDVLLDGFEDLMTHVADAIKYTSEQQTESWIRQMEGWVARIYAAIHDVPLQGAYSLLDEGGYVVHTYRGDNRLFSLEEMYSESELERAVEILDQSEGELADLQEWEREQGIRPGDA